VARPSSEFLHIPRACLFQGKEPRPRAWVSRAPYRDVLAGLITGIRFRARSYIDAPQPELIRSCRRPGRTKPTSANGCGQAGAFEARFDDCWEARNPAPAASANRRLLRWDIWRSGRAVRRFPHRIPKTASANMIPTRRGGIDYAGRAGESRIRPRAIAVSDPRNNAIQRPGTRIWNHGQTREGLAECRPCWRAIGLHARSEGRGSYWLERNEFTKARPRLRKHSRFPPAITKPTWRWRCGRETGG